MNVTRITIARLYSLGNYEHVRYELTAEIPSGESPATAMIGLENIITALDPKRPSTVKTSSELLQMREQIAELKATPDDEVATNYGKSKVVVLHEAEKRCEQMRATSLAWHEHQAKARKLLEDLGGAANWRDAKQEWLDDDQF